MHSSVILRVVGVLLMLFSFSMVPPIVVAFIYNDSGLQPFLAAFLITLLSGLFIWLPVQHKKAELRTRDGFVVVVLFWTVLALSGSLPLYLSPQPDMSFTDAFFESLSGLTTTGATVLTGLDELPKSILYYRQQLQWLGGMGIVVLAVAVLPMLGIGGMQLYRAETPGPIKDSKLTPRIKETAKALWYIYLTLTISCVIAYWAAGMELFDAICHGFSTVAIGGFSTHDKSIGYFNSPLIEAITMFFMLTSAVNFALHFMTRHRGSIRHYFRDPELKVMFGFITAISLVVCLSLYIGGTYDSPLQALRYGLFQTISIATTTGYGLQDFSVWPSLIPIVLLMASFVGACAGSTGGGLKVMRVLLLFKQGSREIRRLVHPNAVFLVKIGNSAVPDRVIEAVWGFVGAYLALFIILMLAVMATGLDFTSGFSAVAASMNNLGPGLGSVANHYGDISSPTKWILCFAMLLGRLEIFTLLVLFSPTFWRR
ncbi:MAG: TrkH family potassium uptake protein [Gammaproteobacteria bacterium]|nr:TrkH family potassium uptake protein [Gammaproteobacteria bacterium]